MDPFIPKVHGRYSPLPVALGLGPLNQPVFYGIPASPAVQASISMSLPFVAHREQAAGWTVEFRTFLDKATGRRKGVTANESVAQTA